MHGLRHAPGSCQVEVSLGMLVLVVILVLGFCGGNGIPVEGTEPRRKSKIYFATKVLLFLFGNNFLLVLQFGTGFCFLCSIV